MNKKLAHYLLALLYTMSLSAQFWQPGNHYQTSSCIFAPGVLASEASMSMYCPLFTASTGETIECSYGIEVIPKPHTSSHFTEIHLQSTKNWFDPQLFTSTPQRVLWSPIILLGYAGSRLAHHVYGINIKPGKRPTNYSAPMHWINPCTINLGQAEDIRCLATAYAQHQKRISSHATQQKHAVVLYGVSRGSATIINFVAHKPQEIHALVLEGIFDSVASISEHATSLIAQAKIKLLALTNFNHHGIVPAHNLHSIPSIPILLITSRNDATVPYQCTLNVYKQLRVNNPNVHLLILKNADHPRYACSNRTDKKLYQNTVHAFYRTYGLPHIQEYADQGQDYFESKTQPIL